MIYKLTGFHPSGRFVCTYDFQLPDAQKMSRSEILKATNIDPGLTWLVELNDKDALDRGVTAPARRLLVAEQRQNCLVNGLLFVSDNPLYHLRYNSHHVIAVPLDTPNIPGFYRLSAYGPQYFFSAFRAHLTLETRRLLSSELGRCPDYDEILGWDFRPHDSDDSCYCFSCSGPIEELQQHAASCVTCKGLGAK